MSTGNAEWIGDGKDEVQKGNVHLGLFLCSCTWTIEKARDSWDVTWRAASDEGSESVSGVTLSLLNVRGSIHHITRLWLLKAKERSRVEALI